jgi:hypothetical protein
MSKAIPSKPPQRPFQPTYSVTTTTRVPGRGGSAVPPADVEGQGPASELGESSLA